MPLKIKCAKCKADLDFQGGLLFSNPDPSGRAVKTHLCVMCYLKVIDFIYLED